MVITRLEDGISVAPDITPLCAARCPGVVKKICKLL